MQKKGFTMVELIVTIVVLAILTSIAYLNLKNYPLKARNTKRISDIKTIQKALDFYYFENQSYPKPDNSILEDGWLKGEAGSGMIGQLGKLTTVVDPSTKKPYSYDLLVTGNAFRLEAKNAEKEYIGYGNYNTDGIYINEATSYVFEIVNNTWQRLDKNCKLPDIDVYNGSGKLIQTWAGCNSTLGNGIEWTNNGVCYKYGHRETTRFRCDKSDLFMKSNENSKDFFMKHLPEGENGNGDIEVDNIWGKFYNFLNAKTNACPNGRHLPTYGDLGKLLSSLGCNDINLGHTGCGGQGWKRGKNVYIQNNLVELLKLPISGAVDSSKASYRKGRRTDYWFDKDISDGKAYTFGIVNSAEFLFFNDFDKASFYPVRCIKNN